MCLMTEEEIARHCAEYDALPALSKFAAGMSSLGSWIEASFVRANWDADEAPESNVVRVANLLRPHLPPWAGEGWWLPDGVDLAEAMVGAHEHRLQRFGWWRKIPQHGKVRP